jgi:hypothetical protein
VALLVRAKVSGASCNAASCGFGRVRWLDDWPTRMTAGAVGADKFAAASHTRTSPQRTKLETVMRVLEASNEVSKPFFRRDAEHGQSQLAQAALTVFGRRASND